MIVTPMSSRVRTKHFLAVGPRTPPDQCWGSLEQDTEPTNSHIRPLDELESHSRGTCLHPYAGGICNTLPVTLKGMSTGIHRKKSLKHRFVVYRLVGLFKVYFNKVRLTFQRCYCKAASIRALQNKEMRIWPENVKGAFDSGASGCSCCRSSRFHICPPVKSWLFEFELICSLCSCLSGDGAVLWFEHQYNI